MIKRFVIVMCFCMTFFGAYAQKSFSEEKPIFFNQALAGMRSMGTEAANKVAFDFQNAWNGNFSTAQQDKIHEIALAMERKDYHFRPHFWYYFSYLAYTMGQAGLTSDDLTGLLKINESVLQTMNGEEYENFLLGLNIFMARRYLVYTNNVKIMTDAGSFAFRNLDTSGEGLQNEPSQLGTPNDNREAEQGLAQGQEDSYEINTDKNPWDNNGDPWADEQKSSNPWDVTGDPWGAGNVDPWNADSGEDPWEAGLSKPSTKQERLIVETYSENFVRSLEMKYVHPEITGAVIELINNSMLIGTPYDSFKIKESSGTYLLNSRVYAGSKATINWPERYKNHTGAVVNLEKFYIGKDRSDFWTPYAKLTFSGFFSGTIEGAFQFKSPKRRAGAPSIYPIFTSNEANVTVKLPNDKMRYTGGVQLSGDQFIGTAVSRKLGKLELLDGKGNRAVLRAEKFVFNGDKVTSERATFSLYHQTDSITHPGVSMWYDAALNQLTVVRTKQYDTRPFYSTYFDVNINGRLLKWDLNTDSIDFSALNGKDLIPVTVESDKYFSEVRFRKLGGGFNFHPLVTSVFYANKFNTRKFNVDELVAEFKITRPQAIGAMRVLAQYGYADYNSKNGTVVLFDKAFHDYEASAQRVDYDNLLLPSIAPNLPNATLSLDSGTLKVRGVKTFYLTSNYKVKIEPHNGEVKVLKGKNLKFDGAITMGDFIYMGRDHHLDYDGFLIQMPLIDSIRIELHRKDSLIGSDLEKKPLSNEITQTSGTLYLDDPKNKSGISYSARYPYFSSSSDAVVYFDGQDVLGGAYDKSVKFLIPPFEEDSLSVDEAISFQGTFNSGGIFPDFEETLKINPDQSLGFVHQIPADGYLLYGTKAKTYEKIYLSNDGIRGGGKIDFITSTIFSEDFVYYPDSVAAYGSNGIIRPGTVGGASYPSAVLGPYRMKWKPRVDSMYLKNLHKPFKFYDATAELTGTVNITSTGVFGSGDVFTRGSIAKSNELTFEELSYSARHASFEVLSNNPEKPAMVANDISLSFDLVNNVAVAQPEKAGLAAFSFPYAQMKTSITKAVWALEDSTVTMTKQPSVPIEKSYFYTTRQELDSLVFNATQAVYDFNTRELNITGIPYINVADAKIIPENNRTTILENAELQTFENAQIIIDTLKGYHYLYDGNIKILSRNQFKGSAKYQLITGIDTFAINFDSFMLENVLVSDKNSQKMTVSGGQVLDKENLLISPGFFYKGKIKMYAYKKALELEGFVKLDLKDKGDNWIKYTRQDANPNVMIDLAQTRYEDESQVIAGLHYDLKGSLYTSFVSQRKAPSDEDFFIAAGTLSFDTLDRVYKIDNPKKSQGLSYAGYTMIYGKNTKDIIFEGQTNFFGPYTEKVKIQSSVLGKGNRETNEYQLDALLAIDLGNKSGSYMSIMAKDLIDLVERLGPSQANDLSIEMLYKLANITSDEITKDYEQSTLKHYIPLADVSRALDKSLVISGVKMKWSEQHRAWYNTTKLGVSNIFSSDINAKFDGFIELKKDESNNDVMNLFLQAAPGTWYFISYTDDNLLLYSSNADFNLKISDISNYGKAKPDELVIVEGDENETLSFINSFRERYFGITTPFDLVFPDEVQLGEEENFDTIEKDKSPPANDGF